MLAPLRTRQRTQNLALGSLALLASFAVLAQPGFAHVKWFAPYVVGARPRPLAETLADPWFWLAILLVLTFLLATITV